MIRECQNSVPDPHHKCKNLFLWPKAFFILCISIGIVVSGTLATGIKNTRNWNFKIFKYSSLCLWYGPNLFLTVTRHFRFRY